MDVVTRQQAPGKSLPSQLMYGGEGYRRLMGNLEVVQQRGEKRGLRGLGMTAEEWADLIKSTTQATLPIIVANNPGTVLQERPDGSIMVYAQPTGSTQNLPVGVIPAGGGYGQAGGGGTIQTPLGSATFGGFDTGTIALIAVAGIGLLLLMQRR